MTKNPLQKRRYVVIAGCFRNIYDVLKKLLRAPWLPMRNVDTHSSCWRSRMWLWPSRRKTPSSETNCRMCQLSQNNIWMEIKKNGQSTSIANEQPCVLNEKTIVYCIGNASILFFAKQSILHIWRKFGNPLSNILGGQRHVAKLCPQENLSVHEIPRLHWRFLKKHPLTMFRGEVFRTFHNCSRLGQGLVSARVGVAA